MKTCPNCKAALDDNARFCLQCMTSLEEKEQIPAPKKKARRWPLLVIGCLLLVALMYIAVFKGDQASEMKAPSNTTKSSEMPTQSESVDSTELDPPLNDPSTLTYSVDGVKYTFRPATSADDPHAITLENHFVLIGVEGFPSDGIYCVPSFVGDNTSALVTAIADGAFDGTEAQMIDLGHNVRYVSNNAFVGCKLTALYLHEDVFINRAALEGCSEELTIHGPDYLENTEGALWSELAIEYGFGWQSEIY